MFEIALINAHPLVARASLGARADDPVLPERGPRRRQAAAAPRERRWWRLRVASERPDLAAELTPRGTS